MKLPFSTSYFRLVFISILLLLMLIMALAVTPAAASGNVCGHTNWDITAGQHILVGSVNVWNDAENLYVEFVTSGNWYMTETHVHVGESVDDIPSNNNGIPRPGHFDYQTSHPEPYVQYVLHTIPLIWDDYTTLVIAAHTSLVEKDDNGDVISEETGWGGPNPGPGPRWWFYIEYTVKPCEPPPPPDGPEGCTPGYWRQAHHYDSWTAPYTPDTIYSAVFMVGPDDRLGDTVQAIGGGLNALLRHSTAALLNAASSDVDYPYTVAEVIAMTQAAINGGDIEGTKDLFDAANNLGCPLN